MSALESLAGFASLVGIIRLLWPETSRLIRQVWTDVTAAILAVRAFWRSFDTHH